MVCWQTAAHCIGLVSVYICSVGRTVYTQSVIVARKIAQIITFCLLLFNQCIPMMTTGGQAVLQNAIAIYILLDSAPAAADGLVIATGARLHCMPGSRLYGASI